MGDPGGVVTTKYNQHGDGGGFRMLKRYHGETCGCCGSPNRERVYQWHSFRYCTTCLHSIGVNAAGNRCTAQQYALAWKTLAS